MKTDILEIKGAVHYFSVPLNKRGTPRETVKYMFVVCYKVETVTNELYFCDNIGKKCKRGKWRGRE